MITREQLKEVGFTSRDYTLYYDAYTFDYQYNVKTQELFSHCEVAGDTELITRVTDIEKFKELIEIYK